MSEHEKARFHDESDVSHWFPVRGSRQPQQHRRRSLPPWKVILHNDDVNDMESVVEAVYQLTPLNRAEAYARMQEAHSRGAALLLVTHRERAELYVEQFRSLRLMVTIES